MFEKLHQKLLLKIAIILFSSYLSPVLSIEERHHSITKRHLLFPRATVLQFTTGISAPLILPRRSINLSLCVQTNYDLPYNLTLLKTKTIQARGDVDNSQRNHNYGFDLSREMFYKYLIEFLDSFDFNGEQCLLRLICEIAEYPMHRTQTNNLLEEIVHYIFTPSLELVVWPNNTATTNATSEYTEKLLNAEQIGYDQGNCNLQYSLCNVSIVDLFTSKYYE